MDTSLAKSLRVNSTPAERRMWRLLFPLRTDGFHFRKQAPIGPYVADFACHHAKLVIEVDGDTHGTRQGAAHDAVRDAFLREEGYSILRFGNRDVISNLEGVMTIIADARADRKHNRRSLPTTSDLPGSNMR